MKSERNAAVVMLGAAMMGLLIANSPFGSWLISIIGFKLNLELININISLGHVVSDLFLALFFFAAGLELKYELRIGTLSSPRKALVPVVAALAGVLVPAAIYLAFNWGKSSVIGWPIPTATDIAFVLGILALFGRGMPKQARIFLLALAIFDDLVAITIIALAYTKDLELLWLLVAGILAIIFRFAEKARSSHHWAIRIGFGLVIWFAIFQSGVHATIAGVLMGIIIPATRSHSVMNRVQPLTNFFVLPLFAFTAVAVEMPSMQEGDTSVFTGIFLGLAIGKAVGIGVASVVANHLLPKHERLPLTFLDFIPLGFLAGIGFTVSLLMAHLAFLSDPEHYAQATLGVLLGSFVAMGIGGAMLWFRARWHAAQKKITSSE